MSHVRNYWILSALFWTVVILGLLGIRDTKRMIRDTAITCAEFGYYQAKIGATHDQMTNQLGALFQKHK